MVNKRKIAMKDIGYADVESYVRTLVCEGLGQQIEEIQNATLVILTIQMPMRRFWSGSTLLKRKSPRETLRPRKSRQAVSRG